MTRPLYVKNARILRGGTVKTGSLLCEKGRFSAVFDAAAPADARVLAISPETRTANAIGDLGGALEDMPRYAVTIGMKEILSAKRVRLGVFRPWHRAVLRRAACGEITSAFPVTLLQRHPDAMLLANDVASELPV